MGGSSLSGMFGGPSTIGSNQYAPANTTPAVMGAMGKLEAFDPTTMAGTYNTPTTPTMENFQSGYLSSSGLPGYVTNFLQQGGTGTLAPPQYTMDPGAGTTTQGTAAAPAAATNTKIPIAPGGGVKPATTGATSSTAGKSGTTDPGAGMTVIPMNAAGGYNQPGLQQSMAVSDQYNMMQGGSQQIASPPRGYNNAPQLMGGPIFTDNKGGFFHKDASGKFVPISGTGPGGADYVKNFFKSWGYA